jgi:hypothetical protein
MGPRIICLGLGTDPQSPPWTEAEISSLDELMADASPPVLTYQPMATDIGDSIVDSIDIDGVGLFGVFLELFLELLS